MWTLGTLVQDATAILNINSDQKLQEIHDLQDKRDYQLFDYVHGLIRNLPIFNILMAPTLQKCNDASRNLCKHGENFLSDQSKWKDALEKFTLAVAFAEPGSEMLALAYSNRSQVFFQQGFSNECFRDIQRALKCNPPYDLKQKLQLRRQQVPGVSGEVHKSLEYHEEVPRIPGSKNKLIRCASRAIGFETNEKWGPHVVAKRDISISEVLAVEDPYISRIHLTERFWHCHECLELCYDLIACPNCPAVMYCKNACRDKAFQEYHKYECILFQMGLKKHSLGLKLSLKAVINYDSFLENLSIDEDPSFWSNRYKEVSTIKTYKEHMEPKQLFLAVLDPVAFYHFLIKDTGILNEFNCENKETVLKEILVRNCLMVTHNNQPVGESVLRKDFLPSPNVVGVGIYPLFSKINHSCFCNTAWIFYGKKMVIRAIMNIKKGEQITISYGVGFYVVKKPERIEKLAARFFNCQCPACEYNWPLKDELRKGTPIPKKLENKILDHLKSGIGNRPVGKGLLEETCNFYNTLKIIYDEPSDNQVTLRGYVRNFLSIMGNTVIFE